MKNKIEHLTIMLQVSINAVILVLFHNSLLQ